METFPFVDHFGNLPPALGKSYNIGSDKRKSVKLDLFYTDTYLFPAIIKDTIRLATPAEIAAMKIDVVQQQGRKKDFWDLHELLFDLSLKEMVELHQKRYEYGHDENLILEKFTDFSLADDDFDPECHRGKFWEVIKDDLKKAVARYTEE